MRFSRQKGHNSKRKKSTGRHRITQNAILKPSLRNALRNGGKNVILSRNCDKKSPPARNRMPMSSAVNASRRNAAIVSSFCWSLNRQYLCNAAVILSARPGSMLALGRKMVVLALAANLHDADASSPFINSMPETKFALFEKGSCTGCMNRSWMPSRWSAISRYFSFVIASFLTTQACFASFLGRHPLECGVMVLLGRDGAGFSIFLLMPLYKNRYGADERFE
jgi:hypothetical protein